MEWRDEGFLLTVRRHGENAAIIEVMTEQHGRHAGVVRGGASRKMAPILQPGAQLQLVWRARLEEHLGSFTVEPIKSRSAVLMADRLSLAGFGSMAALLCFSMAERETAVDLYGRSLAVLEALGPDHSWLALYAAWEMALLEELGFGLDLSKCAATGTRDGLIYVSPKSGSAVSAEAGEPYKDRLLPFPTAVHDPAATLVEVRATLRTTGYFLENWVAPSLEKAALPQARARFMDAMVQIKPEQF